MGYWGRRCRDPKMDAMSGPIVVLMGAMILMAITAGLDRER